MTADSDELRDAVARLANPVVERSGAELVDVEVRGARGSRVVKLVADHDEGLDVDRIAEISRAVGDVLDQQDVIEGTYTFEVTSPGVDRPLRDPRSFRRNVGRSVRLVRNRAAIDRGEKGEVTGTLEHVNEDGVVITVEGSELRVAFDDVDHGKVVLPW